VSIHVTVKGNWDQAKFDGGPGAAAAAKGLTLAAERLKALSVPLTPLDLGDLAGATTVVPASPGNLESKVTNGLVYAARQHEELTWRHKPGRQAKYLEAPAEGNSAELMEIVAAQIRRALG